MGLLMNQMMALLDNNGRVRCPYCGRFRRVEDFPDQPSRLYFEGGSMSVAPGCRACYEPPTPTEGE